MSTEETITKNGEEEKTDSPQPTATTEMTTIESGPSGSEGASTAVRTQREEEDEPRPAGEDFGSLLDQFEQEQSTLQEGEVVRGTVVGITERGVVIDFGYKSEGIVNPNEFMEDGKITVKRGDEVDVLVKNMETGEGFPVLSRADAVRLRAWDDLEKAYNEGTVIKGRVVERIKGGLRVDVDGIAAFLPGSQVDVRPIRNLDSLRCKQIEAKVIKLNRKRSNVVLSRKAVLEERDAGRKDRTLSQIEEDIIVEGQIKNLTDYGAFVDLGGIDGLLHVTDMSWGRLQNPSELFKVGDTVQVKVLKFDRERERVSLGYKQLLPDPWETIEERFPPATRITGKIASVADYGAFVELEPGVEGLVHVSEMSWSKRIKHPSKIVNPGDTVEVEVLSVDPRARRVSLGMKQVQENTRKKTGDRYHLEPHAWNDFVAAHKPGDVVKGKIARFAGFGAFVELGDNLEGLCHISELSDERVSKPEDAVQLGQEMDFRILRIDAENKKIGLSARAAAREEPIIEQKIYTSEAGGGMASLAELADFGTSSRTSEDEPT